jgi:hypothetical protein
MVALKEKNGLRTKINGRFSDIMLMKKKYITVKPLFRNYKKTIHLFIDRRLGSFTCF